MKSKTKNRLTESEIHALVKLHFGCEPEEIRELKGGMFNAIYRMRLSSSGRDVVLKAGVIPGTPLLSYEQDIMPVEVACYRLIQEQTSVPVPEVLAFDFSKRQIAGNYFFMTALEGVPLSDVIKKLRPDEIAHIREQQAEYLEQLHHIEGP